MNSCEEGTADPNYKPHVSIQGIGRVGKPSRMRSRPHRYWVIYYSDGVRSKTGYLTVIAEDLGHFKTGTKAAEAAKIFAEEKNWDLDRYAQSFLKK